MGVKMSTQLLRAVRAVKASNDGTFGCAEKVCVFKGTPSNCSSLPCPLASITCYDKEFKKVKCTEEARKIAQILRQDPSEDLDSYRTYPSFSYEATGNEVQDFLAQLSKGLAIVGGSIVKSLSPVSFSLELSRALDQIFSFSSIDLYAPYSLKGLIVAVSYITGGKGGIEGRKAFIERVASLFPRMKENEDEELFWARFLLKLSSVRP